MKKAHFVFFARPTAALVLVALIGGVARPARAEVDKAACIAAHTEAQALRSQGKLRAAHDALLTCAANACPNLVKVDCTRWIPEVDAEQPTVVAKAIGEEGGDLIEVRLLVDGEVVLEKLDGQALELDPGPHHLRWERVGSDPVEEDVVIAAREKGRVLSVTYHPPETAEPKPKPRGPLPFLVGGLGVVALGTFVGFAVSGKNQLDDLRSNCAPRCDPSERDAVHDKFLVADLALGVAVVSFGVSAWLFLRKQPLETPSSTVGFVPLSGGGIAVAGTSF